MRILASSLLRDQRGSAAEFALVLPLMLLFFFGIIEVGLYGWAINRAEKATQFGARLAVVTDPVASGLTSQSYVGTVVGGVTLTQGDPIPAAALGLITCTSAGCSSFGFDPVAFALIVNRMQLIEPSITAGNVVIEYRGSGLGYAGDPGGMDIAPLTTVRLQNLRFTSATSMLFGVSTPLPSFAYSLTMEDGSGSKSN